MSHLLLLTKLFLSVFADVKIPSILKCELISRKIANALVLVTVVCNYSLLKGPNHS